MKLSNNFRNLLFIVASVVVSMFFSMTANLDKAELGALENLIYPPLVGLLCIVIYLVSVYLFKWNPIIVTIVCCIAIILLGVKLHYAQ